MAPAAHYLCGGIKVDTNACSSIQRLYAVGECSCTGLHGGNRLASNSLIEAVVYADAAAKHSMEHIDQYTFREDIPEWDDKGTQHTEEMVLITQSAKEVGERVEAMNPAYFDVLPLSLEEIFIYELGGVDYAIKEIVL